MKKLLIATHNPAKIEEIKKGLFKLISQGLEIITLTDVGVEKEPEETGKTIKENSEIKARYYANLTGLPTLSDDGGFFIPYLNGEPGVKSARWLGHNSTDMELIDYTLLRLKNVKYNQRTAYLETCVTFFFPKVHSRSVLTNSRNWTLIFEQERINGHVAEKPYPHWLPGFPYRALLIVDQYNKYYDQLTVKEHDAVNHRLKAMKRLTKKIRYLLI